MTKVLIVRRRRLGYSTCKAFSELLEQQGLNCKVWRNDRSFPMEWLQHGSEDSTYVLRWGCTATIPMMTTGPVSGRYLNQAAGIHAVNNKLQFLVNLPEMPTGLLPVITRERLGTLDQVDTYPQWVVRPQHHSQGRNLLLKSFGELQESIQNSLTPLYARPLVQKKAEYRAYVINGKVVNLAKKTPANPDAVAWNVAQGGRFDNVRWGDWPINVVDLACRIFPHTGLNITGIDIMVDHDDNAWFVEANSAPSLPYNSDGSHTYRQKCMAKGVAYTIANQEIFPYQKGETWREYVHPAIGR